MHLPPCYVYVEQHLLEAVLLLRVYMPVHTNVECYEMVVRNDLALRRDSRHVSPGNDPLYVRYSTLCYLHCTRVPATLPIILEVFACQNKSRDLSFRLAFFTENNCVAFNRCK